MPQQAQDDLVKGVLARLERDPRTDLHHWPIKVSMASGVLVLEGVVDNICAKKAASRVAHEVAQQIPVYDRLKVSASEPKEDGALRDEIVNALLEEPVFKEYALMTNEADTVTTLREGRSGEQAAMTVSVNDGSVALSGQVGSLTHRRLAEVLCWWTAGCESVDNRLRVVPAEAENDDELADALRAVLEKDPLVHSDQVTIRVRAGVVTLGGYVHSSQERKLAVLDACYVPGVHEVVDEIRARA